MTVSALAILITYCLIVSFWKALHLLLLFYKPRRYFLGRKAPRLQGNDGPRLSIILAAKDEEAGIGDCVRSVLQAEYTHFELIVVDDRSTDATAAEVEKAAAGDPRVRLLRIQQLPPGWTGKMHAVRQGLAQATGSIYLIMDADTRHTPRTLGAALALMERKRIALLSLLPGIEHRTLFSKMVQPVVGSLVMFWKPLPWVNSRKRKHVALGWGGFLMVRKEVLEAVGGLEAVKDRFAADIALVSRVKQADRRIRVLHAPDLISTYMYATSGEILKGWTRLLRITADNRPRPLVWTLLALGPLCLSAYLAVGIGLASVLSGQDDRFALLLGGMGVMHLFFQLTLFGRLYRLCGNNPLYALAHLPAVLVTGYLTALALLRIRSSQLTWRGTSYQLKADGSAGTAHDAAVSARVL